jgi:para-aminobenzoate synthetase component 1
MVRGLSNPPRPLDAVRIWPARSPLAALVSGPAGRGGGAWARRSILAEPKEVRCVRIPPGTPEREARRAIEAELRGAFRRRVPSGSPHAGWIVSLSYDLGRILEPAAQAPIGAGDDRDWPLALLAWCPDTLVLDHASGEWTIVGDPAGVPVDARRLAEASPGDLSFRTGPVESPVSREGYEWAVSRTVELIHAGDLFQANLARRLETPFTGSVRGFAAAALEASGAWFGGLIEDEGRAIVSMSPELFLDLDARRRVVTRPIKGTLPAAADPARLLASEKDGAELAMIVDLMRNDLGRVCEIGSIRVKSGRAIESHPTVHHGVAEISGTLQGGLDRFDLLAATFPPGSVTGAPKIRAMQVIDELEPARRGPYCGAIGILGGDGSMTLNVAIRTAAISGRSVPHRVDHLEGTLDYWAGCGIVADSRPDEEWCESETKSRVLRLAVRDDGQ